MTDIIDIIECALAKAGLDILSVEDDCLVVRNSEQDQDFEIKMTELPG